MRVCLCDGAHTSEDACMATLNKAMSVMLGFTGILVLEFKPHHQYQSAQQEMTDKQKKEVDSLNAVI